MWNFLFSIIFRSREKKIRNKVLLMMNPFMINKCQEHGCLEHAISLLTEPYILSCGTKKGNCYYVRMEGRIGKCTVMHLLKNNDEYMKTGNNYCNDFDKKNAFNCKHILNSKKR